MVHHALRAGCGKSCCDPSGPALQQNTLRQLEELAALCSDSCGSAKRFHSVAIPKFKNAFRLENQSTARSAGQLPPEVTYRPIHDIQSDRRARMPCKSSASLNNELRVQRR